MKIWKPNILHNKNQVLNWNLKKVISEGQGNWLKFTPPPYLSHPIPPQPPQLIKICKHFKESKEADPQANVILIPQEKAANN